MPDYMPDELESDDEDGYPWDFERFGDLGNYDEEEKETGADWAA